MYHLLNLVHDLNYIESHLLIMSIFSLNFSLALIRTIYSKNMISHIVNK